MSGVWSTAQNAVLDVIGRSLGFEQLPPEPVSTPTKAQQLHLLGLVIMADWIASNSDVLPSVWDLDSVSLDAARARARAGWDALGLRGGWRELAEPDGDVVQRRFGFESRPFQSLVVDAARRTPRPSLILVEAPMGEGKTEAALAAAEILAARFGADGIFVGMPTQATSDPMYHRVRAWADEVQSGLPVALLHGRARFNPEWMAALAAAEARVSDHPNRRDQDEFEMDDPYSAAGPRAPAARSDTDVVPAPAHWFLGRGRPLLTPLAVGTIDQLLMAGTRTRHVMLRFAGVAGKVVVLDEVHSADVYMSRFLHEALWWLGQAGVPVILLSATLTPRQRHDLTRAYLAGAASRAPQNLELATTIVGYPSVLTAWADEDGAHAVATASPARADGARDITVTHLVEDPTDCDAAVVQLLRDRLRDGGCALVIRNTVGRAQSMSSALRAEFGDDVLLLHARLTAADRASRTSVALDELGPPPAARPARRVIVATQLAEQSFDIDADLVVTDLAPVDLILQRAGRLHRHAHDGRPEQVRSPEVVVTGFGLSADGTPTFDPGSEAIYSRHLLLRAAKAVLDASRADGWHLPSDIPRLVADAYAGNHQGPPAWAAVAAQALIDWSDRERQRADRAATYTLTRPGAYETDTIAGLHRGSTLVASADEEPLSVVVRDGERSVEVVVLREDEHGYRTWNGRPLGPNGDTSPDVVDDVAAGLLRLPARASLTSAADSLRPLPGWVGHAWLGYAKALVLDETGSITLGGFRLRYDDALGLLMERAT
jgi:CRISPR-associated endonuclease/helicase Cas3